MSGDSAAVGASGGRAGRGGPFGGQVVLITGAARGQGRNHAVEFARLGADVALCDLCHDLGSVGYPLATEDDLAETTRLVEEAGGRCVSAIADVRDLDALVALAERTRTELGPVDVLVANAGVSTLGSVCSLSAEDWDETVDTNLGGVFRAIRAVAPMMRERRRGRIVAISSMMGRSANPGIPAYVASKWGVIGLVKSAALELAGFGITVNAIAPGNVSTAMIHNDVLYRLMRPDLDEPTADDVAPAMTGLHAQPVPWIDPAEITAAVVFLAGPGAAHITGAVIDVSAGASARFTA